MHEWALAEAVLESVKQEAQKEPGRQASRVTVLFGELQSIELDIFAEGLRQLQETADGSQVEFTFTEEPAVFRCTACSHRWPFAQCDLDDATREAIHFLPEVAHSFISCPSCGSSDFRVEKGRGVTISEIHFVPEGSE